MLKNYSHRQTISVNHVGQVGAGTAVEFFDHPRASLILRPQWVRDFSEVATAEVCGDSLVDEGIFDGDKLVCKVIFDAAEIKPGKLVVVRIPTGRSVVKRIFFDGEHVLLRSANPAYEDMVFEKDAIQVEGIVKELSRKLD